MFAWRKLKHIPEVEAVVPSLLPAARNQVLLHTHVLLGQCATLPAVGNPSLSIHSSSSRLGPDKENVKMQTKTFKLLFFWLAGEKIIDWNIILHIRLLHIKGSKILNLEIVLVNDTCGRWEELQNSMLTEMVNLACLCYLQQSFWEDPAAVSPGTITLDELTGVRLIGHE